MKTENCYFCDKAKSDVKEVVIKVNGYLGYYNKTVHSCEDCVAKHNRLLLETWGS